MPTSKSFANNATKMMLASVISMIAGVVQVFWIPKILSVEEFGYWRVFILYTGYAGVLHLGLVDGALLRWSTQPEGPVRSQLAKAARFLLLLQLAVVLLGAALCLLPAARRPHLPIIVVGLLLYALAFNLVGLFQVSLQAQNRFTAVAFAVCAPQGCFMLALPFLHYFGFNVETLVVCYVLVWLLSLVLLWRWAFQNLPEDAPQHPPRSTSPWVYLVVGWPILLANLGTGVMQSADRVTVNATRPIHDFAIYSLSQSMIYVPIALIASLSRVVFSHLARSEKDARGANHRSMTRVLLILWMFLLPYFFAVEWVVHQFLPKYSPGLPSGCILLLSVLFLAYIQIVQMPAFSLTGRQVHFFYGSVVAVALAFLTAWAGSVLLGSLQAVAWSQVLTAGLWWLGNEWYLHREYEITLADTARILAGFVIASLLLLGLPLVFGPSFISAALYFASIAVGLFFLLRADFSNVMAAVYLKLRRGAK